MDETYAWAAERLEAVGAGHVARRIKRPSWQLDLDRTPMSRAIMAAVDAVDCRRAAALDAVHARRWNAIAQDQARISAATLSLGWVGEVAG